MTKEFYGISMEVQVFDSKKFKDVKWKNGGGITRELFKHPPGTDDYIFRLSVAKIESDGPFSHFKDYMRALVMLEGSVVLEHNGSEIKLSKGESYKFQGAWDTHCRLTSKNFAKDFNFIYKPQLVSAQVASIQLKNSLNLRINGDEEFFYLAEGCVEIIDENGQKLTPKTLAAGDLICIRSDVSNQVVKLKSVSIDSIFLIHIVVKYRKNSLQEI